MCPPLAVKQKEKPRSKAGPKGKTLAAKRKDGDYFL
jgi:hypothetical protein